ncbi:hypothetical protein GXW83_04490 [Streptacidiphilus sp. PB12-B1b]|uniref:SCO4983 family protein n=1 Tax=Streptacidiphilus sp. PB12-B1b TaxID=2705012 RepID=UPI0015FC0368|nr:hypothetical protein [Streptacidiphilus sp. PB12-B1b]QMU75129.1 hypothetical protein GXW83_04490 [Streptacidiphilus sp. PB12-B1b]
MPAEGEMYEQTRTTVSAQRRPAARAHNSSTPGAPGTTARTALPHGAPLSGHLAALVTATEAIRDATPDPARRAELDAAAHELADRLTQLAPTGAPLPHTAGAHGGRSLAAAHEHAHALAGRLLVVAAAQQDTVTAMLACRRMDAHAAARSAR